MNSSELTEVAWDLVEQCRGGLTAAELNDVFVMLGVGEFTDAMEIVLKAVVSAAGPPLPDRLLARLSRIARVHYVDDGFLRLLASASRLSA